MANGPKRGMKRQARKAPKRRRSSSQNPFIMQSVGAVISIVLVIFLKTANIISETIAILICMIILSVMFYLMFAGKPRPRKRRKKRSKKSQSDENDPQFYTALPSTLGLTEIPEQAPTPEVKLPPRPIRAARRRRDFVTYPLAVGGGNYSDSYVQVDKDTVLRLRSEMSPDLQTLKLPGARIPSFPSTTEAPIMSQETEDEVPVVAEPIVADATAPVAAEPIVADATAPVAAEPIVADATAPVVAEPIVADATVPVAAEPIVADSSQGASPVVNSTEDEEEEMEFDMEWD